MQWISTLRNLSFGLVAVGAMSLVGCTSDQVVDEPASDTTEVAQSVPAHGAWWCGEHGVPEEECALCDSSLIAEFKEKGDWCEEHARPESQCFLCSPSRFDKFAARYEAKMGEKPPRPEGVPEPSES